MLHTHEFSLFTSVFFTSYILSAVFVFFFKVIEIIEECGGVVVVQEACSGIKPIEEPVSEEGDPLEAIARKFFNIPCSCMTPNKGRTVLIKRLAEEFRANAVIDLVWQACHTYNVESYFIEKFVNSPNKSN